MKTRMSEYPPRALERVVVGALLLLALILLGLGTARAGELIPSLGVTRGLHDEATESKLMGSLAFRSSLAPFLMSEVAVSYRQDELEGGDVLVRQWPITASIYARPLSSLYAGGGVGWYQTTYDYRGSLGMSDETHQNFGVHLGGGLAVPIAPRVGVDLSARWVHLQKPDSPLIPSDFNPDFWTTTLGLAFKF